MNRQNDTSAVRVGEELPAARIASFLGVGNVEIAQFPGGHSNLTYLVRANGEEFVLRRAPLGPVAPKAHDMAREFRVLSAIHPHFPEAPKPYRLCEDAAVIGSVFFLMERRRGVVLRNCGMPGFERRISESFVDCLARLHAIDVQATGLIALGKPEGFVRRQVEGWAQRWQRAQTETVAGIERAIEVLHRSVPEPHGATIVHNDYKLDNVMLGEDDPGRVEAVLDWEMTTIGDPLADLGLTLCYWCWSETFGPSDEGWYTREEVLERYAARTDRDVSTVPYYELLGVFKLAVIVQQIYYRYRCGQTSDARFRDFDARVRRLGEIADGMIERFGL